MASFWLQFRDNARLDQLGELLLPGMSCLMSHLLMVFTGKGITPDDMLPPISNHVERVAWDYELANATNLLVLEPASVEL